MTETEEEKKNQRTAAISTAGICVAVVLLMFVVAAWRAPDPPLPEYGIELNFGVDNQGSGAEQPRQPTGTPQATEDQEPEAPAEAQPEVTDTQPTQEAASQPQQTATEQPISSTMESPVAVKEEKKETPKPVEKTKEKTAETKAEPKKEEAPKPDSKALYNPRAGQAQSQGDDKDKAGDKGNPQGSLDANALYGKQGGGGGGPSLDLKGWQWDNIPKPQVPNNESGQIKIRLKVNEDGEVIGYDVLERSVSAAAETACIQAIQRLTFSKEPGAVVPAVSIGTITFVMRPK